METMLNYTKSTGYECAGRICAKKGCISDVKITNLQIGNEICVDLPKRCKTGYINIGAMHTHAGRDKCILSLLDMENHILSNHIIDCLGADGKVMCFARKKVTNFKKNLELDIANAIRQVQLMIDEKKVAHGNIDRFRSGLEKKLNKKYFNKTRLI